MPLVCDSAKWYSLFHRSIQVSGILRKDDYHQVGGFPCAFIDAFSVECFEALHQTARSD